MLRFLFGLPFILQRHGLAIAQAGILALVLSGAGGEADATPAGARRVVTIGGAVTEIVYALGLGDRVVAVDTSSTFPPEALRDNPNVGYMRALSPEGVLSVGPTLIIAIEGAGPPDAVRVLKGAAVPFEIIPEARDASGVLANIRRIAELMGVSQRGEELASAVEQDFAALAALRSRIIQQKDVAFVLSASGPAPIVGGAHTGADAMFALAGVGNAMKAISGYKPAVTEAVIGADPYAIVLMKDSNHALSDAVLASLPAFAGSRAAAAGRFFRMDGSYLLGFGPRTPQAARDLAALVYPELGLPELPSHAWTTSTAP